MAQDLRSTMGSTLTEFILLKRNVKSSFSCCISLVWKFQNVVCGFLTKELKSFYAIWLIKIPCCSPLPEAKDGVEPSFQDLQSDTFPLCYLAKPATSCAKVKRLFFLPRSLFFYICGGGRSTLYDRLGLPEKRGQLLSPLPCFFWLKVASHSTTGTEAR